LLGKTPKEGNIDDEILCDAIATVLPDLIDDEQHKILPQAFNFWKYLSINKNGTITRRRKEIAEAKLNSISSDKIHLKEKTFWRDSG
jgi:hypothetical protein